MFIRDFVDFTRLFSAAIVRPNQSHGDPPPLRNLHRSFEVPNPSDKCKESVISIQDRPWRTVPDYWVPPFTVYSCSKG